MKDARAADYLRRLESQKPAWTTNLHRIALDGVPSIGQLEIPIQTPLTVLAGPNGVGKTTLLRTAWAALDPEIASKTLATDVRFSAGSIVVEASIEGIPAVSEVVLTPDGITTVSASGALVGHVDGASFATNYRREFCAFESVEELVNGIGMRELDGAALGEISYILSRSYRSVRVFEVELDGVVPFFEVDYGNDRYDSRTMGTGEISALYVWWCLDRAERSSIVLIEEPEAYLSTGSQNALANHLISTIVKKRLCALVSSHSPAFIASMPADCLVFLSRGEAGLHVITDRPHPSLLRQMGIIPALAAIVYVEDSLARLLAKAILEKYDPQFARQVFISQRNGDGEVKAALKPNLTNQNPIAFVGLFDGDLRGTDLGEYAAKSVFLPGNEPIERAFMSLAKQQPECLQHPSAAIVMAALEGRDHHDWYDDLARELGLSRDQLFSRLFLFWIGNADNEAAALATYRGLLDLTFPPAAAGPSGARPL